MMKSSLPANQLTPPYRIRRHPVDWAQGDPADPTFQWLSNRFYRLLGALGSAAQTGCHFITPEVTVSSREPNADFFREVINQRGRWLREFRRAAGNSRYREASRLLTDSARQRTLSGVMLIGGVPIPTRDWQARADGMVSSVPKAKISVIRRRVDLENFKISGNNEPLEALTRFELQAHISASPDAALYVNPGITVSAPVADAAFLDEARKRSAEWHGKLSHALRARWKALLSATNQPTLMLVFHGTLVINGECYIPGCWPNDQPNETRLGQTPFRSPTVPLSFLGLTAKKDDSESHLHKTWLHSPGFANSPHRGGSIRPDQAE